MSRRLTDQYVVSYGRVVQFILRIVWALKISAYSATRNLEVDALR